MEAAVMATTTSRVVTVSTVITMLPAMVSPRTKAELQAAIRVPSLPQAVTPLLTHTQLMEVTKPTLPFGIRLSLLNKANLAKVAHLKDLPAHKGVILAPNSPVVARKIYSKLFLEKSC
jgi:hypothetical protein